MLCLSRENRSSYLENYQPYVTITEEKLTYARDGLKFSIKFPNEFSESELSSCLAYLHAKCKNRYYSEIENYCQDINKHCQSEIFSLNKYDEEIYCRNFEGVPHISIAKENYKEEITDRVNLCLRLNSIQQRYFPECEFPNLQSVIGPNNVFSFRWRYKYNFIAVHIHNAYIVQITYYPIYYEKCNIPLNDIGIDTVLQRIVSIESFLEPLKERAIGIKSGNFKLVNHFETFTKNLKYKDIASLEELKIEVENYKQTNDFFVI